MGRSVWRKRRLVVMWLMLDLVLLDGRGHRQLFLLLLLLLLLFLNRLRLVLLLLL